MTTGRRPPSRRTGRLDDAFIWYGKALAIDPLHRGANEYLGGLLLETSDVAKARERLAALEIACPNGCEEHDELAEAIDAATRQGLNPTHDGDDSGCAPA